MSSERVRQRLTDIVENIDRIASHIGAMSAEAFRADAKTVDAVERCLQRITEAVIKIGPEHMAALVPGLPVREVRAMGNMLRHEYDSIDLGVLWTTIKVDLPQLKLACEDALSRAE